MQLNHFTIEQGLPTNVINCGLEDKEGFIWLGTREGLVRYDGEIFKTFTTAQGLLANNIIRIVQIEDEWLWVLCGLNSFDNNLGGEFLLFNTTTYECVSLVDKFPDVDVPYFRHVAPYQDTALILYSKESQFYTYGPYSGLQALDIESDTDNNFMVSENGNVWVSKVGSERGTFTAFSFDFYGHLKEEYTITDVVREPFFLIGFTHSHRPIGTVHFDADSKQVLGYLDTNGKLVSLTDNIAAKKQEEKVYQFCGATVYLNDGAYQLFRPKGQGVYLMDRDGAAKQLLTEDESTEIPIGNLRFVLFTSRDDIVWWCTPEGLFKLSLKDDKFRKWLSSSDLGRVESIRGITPHDGNFYASSDQRGVVGLDNYGVNLRVAVEQALFLMKRNDYLYFNREGIVTRYGLKTDKVDRHKVAEIGDLWSVFVDTKGNWWYGGGKGVRQSTQWNGEQVDMTQELFSGVEGQVLTLQIFEEANKLWFATTKGLFSYHRETKQVERVGVEVLKDVHHVCRDERYWWVSTNGKGLVQWDRQKNKFRQFTTDHGLSSNTLYACLKGHLGNLWVSSNYGLMRIDTAGFTVATYTIEDGLPHNEFNRVSWCKAANGYLYFGGLNGFVEVRPEEFSEPRKPYNAPLQVSSFLQYDEGEQKLRDRTTDVRSNERIVVTPKSGFFALTVNLLDYKDDRKLYSYLIEGLQTDWIALDNNVLQLGDLPFGTYQLRLKGQNQRGEKSSNELALELLVLKPFYLEWWFISIIVALLIAIIIGVVRWRTWRLKQERKRLRQKVDEQTEELQKSVAQKDVLLREIHHRVKNNLQVISSLLNLERTAGHDAKTLELIMEARHRIKSMALIHKNLYQHDDLSSILMKEYFEELISGLHASYARKKKKVSYAVQCNVESLEVDTAIPLGIMVTEVVTNSFKYAFGEMDEGLVELSFREDRVSYNLVVSDNGPGLPDEYLQLRTKSLGLRLIKLLIGQLKGQVRVENKNGTAFIFEFPKETDLTSQEQ